MVACEGWLKGECKGRSYCGTWRWIYGYTYCNFGNFREGFIFAVNHALVTNFKRRKYVF